MEHHIGFERARRALATSHRDGTTLCAPFVDHFPISGAAVSVMVSGASGQSTICASDDVAARIDELQFDLGEGPCWDAMGSHSPVLTPDLAVMGRSTWPAFGEAVARDDRASAVASVFAFPLTIGSLEIGAIDLYSVQPTELQTTAVSEASELADIAAWQVLRKILGEELDEVPRYSRREIHQATGMIIAQLDVTAEEASLLLRAHAFATSRSVRDLANDVIARRIDFSENGRSDDPPVG